MGTAPKLVSCIVAIGPSAPSAKEYRSREVTREFQREHPCPSTGRTSGACPGYRKDHISRSPAADPTRFGTFNGKPSPMPRLRTDGSGGLAVADSAILHLSATTAGHNDGARHQCHD